MNARYTRYTLAVAAPPGDASTPVHGRAATARRDVDRHAYSDGMAPPGAADHAHADGTAPPDAVDYAYADAVALARAMGATGWQETGDGVVFWLPAEPTPDAGLLTRLGALGRLEVADEEDDWQRRWREYHRPVVVGPLHVRAPWHAARAGLLDLCIDVGMAFGTGGHATTRQCLEGLTRLTPGRLVDLGTGSGVLALAAARLGFAPVLGLDLDSVAVEAARANARANDLDAEFAVADVTCPAVPLPAVDVAVANLALLPVLGLATRVARCGHAGWRPPRLLLSGLLEKQGEQVVAAFVGYRVRRRAVDEGWLFLDLEDAGTCGCR